MSAVGGRPPSPGARLPGRGDRVHRLPVDSLLSSSREGDLGAREELVRHFVPLAKRLAGRYRHSGEPQEDLEQVAYLGLIKAIDRYDPGLGSFDRYAVPTIIGELKRHFRDKGWGMRLARSMQERALEVNDAMFRLSTELGRSPTVKDVVAHTGLPIDDVIEALEAMAVYSPASLDAPYSPEDDGARTLGDSLGGEDPGYRRVDVGQAVAPAFRALPAREQAILKLRFVDDLTQSEIAEHMGMSQMHVSRLLRRSLERLGEAAAEGQSEPRRGSPG